MRPKYRRRKQGASGAVSSARSEERINTRAQASVRAYAHLRSLNDPLIFEAMKALDARNDKRAAEVLFELKKQYGAEWWFVAELIQTARMKR